MDERTEDRNGLTAAEGRRGRSLDEAIPRALLICGFLSSLLYLGSDALASMRLAGYRYADQAVSELMAIGASTRPLMLVLMSAYNLLVIAFAVGVWRSAGTRRSVRVVSVTLVVYAVVGELTQLFSPMHVRGSVASGTDIGHMILTAIEVLSIVAFIAFGSGVWGRGFRLYSIVSILIIMAGGIVTGMLSTHMTALVSSTPWAGLTERVNIYGTMLWIAMFGVMLLRSDRERGPVAEDGSSASGRAPKKVTAFVGSAHAGGATYTAARTLLDDLESLGDVEGEIVVLSDYDIGTCRGCKVCFERGEDRCPLKDDRDVLIGKMEASDAVVFASPNYSFQVSGATKVFLDRLGFLFHRPRFHGKSATAIVVQGMYGGRRIRQYLEFAEGGLGFKTVKGSVIHTLEPMTAGARQKMDAALMAQSRRLHEQVLRPPRPVPSLIELMAFRMSRTGVRIGTGADSRDRAYYRDRGWFESDYYYPTHLGPLRRAAGAVFDWAGARIPTFKVAHEAEPE